MNSRKAHKDLWKQRLTLLAVVLFCVLISSSEYLIQMGDDGIKTEQQSQEPDSSDKNDTFIHNAVDAVVPFVVVFLDQVFHLIYELVTPERQANSLSSNLVVFPNALFEVLFEHIVSSNAP